MLRRLGIISSIMRGAKKGKGKGEEVKIEATTDIINIFKDRTDPELKPASEYPEWLFPMVYEYYEHPLDINMKMYRGEKIDLPVRTQKRIKKWTQRTRIIVKNHTTYPKHHCDPRRLELMELGLPGGEDTDQDPDDILGPLFKMAMGAPPTEVIQEYMEVYNQASGIPKKDPTKE
jgi:Mitochondrial ribosomal protein L37